MTYQESKCSVKVGKATFFEIVTLWALKHKSVSYVYRTPKIPQQKRLRRVFFGVK